LPKETVKFKNLLKPKKEKKKGKEKEKKKKEATFWKKKRYQEGTLLRFLPMD